MDNLIKNAFETTRNKIDATMKELRENRVAVSDITAKGGIYAFWNADKAVYIGRAKNILNRYKQHLGINKNQSPLARKIAKEELAKNIKGCEGKKYLVARYKHEDEDNKIRENIEKHLKSHKNEIKKYLEGMEFSFVKQESTLHQYLAEMFCSIGLGTVVLNKDGEEEDNIEEAEEAGKIYYKYRFYNSFKTS